MNDLLGWYGDLWQHAWHNFAAFVVLAVASAVVLLVVLGGLLKLLGFAGDLGASFRDGWRSK